MRSAIANANEIAEKANISIDPDDLWVRTAFVDRGPTKNRRRVRPAPQGRAYREQRHFCHVTISLSNDERPEANGKQARNRQRSEAGEARGEQTPQTRWRRGSTASKARDAKKEEPEAAD